MVKPLGGALALAACDIGVARRHVERQWLRVLLSSDDVERHYDIELLAVALRWVVQCAGFAAAAADEASDQQAVDRIRAAAREFDSAAPGAKTVRDILEHHDDYRLGRGVRQRKDPDPMKALFGQYVEEGESGPILVLGERYRLDVAAAVEASYRLAGDVLHTLHYDDWRPKSVDADLPKC
jgi:hypothetical protein